MFLSHTLHTHTALIMSGAGASAVWDPRIVSSWQPRECGVAAAARRARGARPALSPHGDRTPSGRHREAATSVTAAEAPAGATPGNPPWSRQSREGRIKGTAAGEGLRTREGRLAVDPHGLQVHGSHQAPTCWARTGCRR